MPAGIPQHIGDSPREKAAIGRYGKPFRDPKVRYLTGAFTDHREVNDRGQINRFGADRPRSRAGLGERENFGYQPRQFADVFFDGGKPLLLARR